MYVYVGVGVRKKEVLCQRVHLWEIDIMYDMYVCVRERQKNKKRGRESMCVCIFMCMCVYESVRMCVFVCVCMWEKESVFLYERVYSGVCLYKGKCIHVRERHREGE